MKSFRWGMGALGLAVAAVIGLGALGLGIAAQAQGGEDSPIHSRFLEILADKLGISVDQLQTDINDSKDQAIDEAVADGSITDAQGERLKNLGFGDLRLPGAGMRVMGAIKDVFGSAADVIGIDTDALRSELQDGKSLATIAGEHGVSRDDLIAGITSAVEAQLQTAVDDGKITADQQQQILDSFNEHIEDLVDRAHGDGPFDGSFDGFRGERFHRFHMGEEAAP